ncbi:MAG: TfoX/Sxy family protein [Bacteroidota bacterium]
MAYDEYQAERIRNTLTNKKVAFEELKMMGGLCFKVDGKMLCGIHLDKKLNDHLLMARIGEAAYPDAIEKNHVLPMDFTGRPMRGYIFVQSEGFDLEDDLAFWLQKCLDFNPLAKASKKRKKKV